MNLSNPLDVTEKKRKTQKSIMKIRKMHKIPSIEVFLQALFPYELVPAKERGDVREGREGKIK